MLAAMIAPFRIVSSAERLAKRKTIEEAPARSSQPPKTQRSRPSKDLGRG
jgi:hypothetical protein